MKITHETQDKDAWKCLCGNEPSDDGFYPCDENGKEVEPDHNWNGIYYRCNRCSGRINQNTLEIMYFCAPCGIYVDAETMPEGDICELHAIA